MHDICYNVAVVHGGSLKAEHGTGRNVAPFVEMEWGTKAYELMWEVRLEEVLCSAGMARTAAVTPMELGTLTLSTPHTPFIQGTVRAWNLNPDCPPTRPPPARERLHDR